MRVDLFCFITVGIKEVLLHTCFYCREVGFNVGQRWVEERFGAEEHLGVIALVVVEVT